MGERLRFDAEEKRDVAGPCLLSAQAQPQPGPIDGVLVLRPFRLCRGRRQENPLFPEQEAQP